MTKYIDAQGRTWPSAEEALQDFIDDLPPLTDEEQELAFSATNHEWPASRNLAAIEYAIHYHGLSQTFGYYPIPHPWDEHPTIHYLEASTPATDPIMAEAYVLAGALAVSDGGWSWDESGYMIAADYHWDIAHVPFFQVNRVRFNHRFHDRRREQGAFKNTNARRAPVIISRHEDHLNEIWED